MATCSSQTLIQQACESGFTCRNEPELLALLNQLLCNYIASGGGGGAAVWGGITGTLTDQADLVAALAAAQAAAIASSRNAAGAGSPVGVVTPAYVGQTYTDTTAPYGFWTSVAATSADWIQLY